ncbi:hypothetical protein HOG48_06405 [Candidatus Peregrinibacteria bacterium]|jgi:branched-chain amino acid aminotransferase|nr:hypothetical protein [Candidatus Peregrinibacteria bacterium]
MIVFLNGKFVSENDAVVGVNDAGFLYGHGVYETLRAFDGKLKFLDEHLDRLNESAAAFGLEVPYSKNEIKGFLEELVGKNLEERKDLRIRITLTAGEGSFYTGESGQPTFLITTRIIYEENVDPVSVATLEIERTYPQIKSTSMISNILAKNHARSQGAFESIMIDRRGRATEGTFTNLFIVKNGVLKTPGQWMLSGITRKMILELAPEIMPVEECDIFREELYDADEILLTNSVKGIVSVREVDGRVVGDGEMGKFTQRIQKKYLEVLHQL